MHVDVLMSKNPVTVEMDDTLATVSHLFDEYGFHHLLVLEKGKLFGVISDRDLLKAMNPKVGTVAASTQDLACLNKRAHQIMTRSPVVLKKGAGIHEAIAIFNQYKISCIPVVDDNDVPVGLISWRDIMKVIGQNRIKKQ